MKVILIRSTEIFNDSRATKEIKAFLKNDFKVTVLGWNRKGQVQDDKVLEENGNKANIKLYNKKCNYADGMKSIFKMLGFQIFIFKNLIKYHKDYDIIHCCDFDTTLTVKFISKLFDKKIVYDIFDYYIDCHNLGRLKNFIEKKEIKMINNADLTIICTEQRKEQIKKANPKNLIVIHNTPNIEIKENKKIIMKNDPKKFKIVYVGILQGNRLLKEIGEEITKHNDLELHIGGFGKYEDYFKKLSEKNDNVFYYGSLDYASVLSLEKDCDLLFATYNPEIPNHKYSAPNKVYEAMCLGKPIIVCKNTGVDKLIIKEDIGLSINYDAKDFIKAIHKLKKEYNLKELTKRSKNLYENKYSWKSMEEKLIEEYKKLGR